MHVLIVEDHAVVREGTRELLEHDSSIEVADAGTAHDALEAAARLHPDVILLDLALPDGNGISAIPALLEAAPGCKILVLSAYDDDDYVLAAMEAGAMGYLLKTVRGREVVESLHLVDEGEVVLHPSIADKLLRSQRHQLGGELSARERELLALAARGFRNKEIARALHISVRTVEAHFSHILTKLGVSSRTEAVVHGVARRWFTVA